MMNSQELETAIRPGVELTVIIVNDGGAWYDKMEKRDSMSLPSFDLEFGNPDFVEYAASFGARGWRIGSEGLSIIDCPVDYSENVKILTDELTARTCRL